MKNLLPLGSVVRLNKGELKIMIISRLPLYNNEGTIGYFDYAACVYPTGQADQQVHFFNEEDIEEVTSEITKSSEGDIKKVRMSLIEPNKKQPRRHFDEEKITALADSIKEHGLIQPIIITPSDNNMYKIVAGERRWRAAKKANLKEIPAVIRKYSEEQVAEIALIENLQRENLNPIEEAIGYNLLMDEFNLTQELISQRVGKSRSAIANSLRLLSLEDEIQKMLILGTLTSGHARAILSLDDKELRIALSKRIIEDNLM